MYPMEMAGPGLFPMEGILPPATFDPSLATMQPPNFTMPPVKPDLLGQVGLGGPASQGSAVDPTGAANPNDWYKYAVLASIAGPAGVALGQAFRPRHQPPPPIAPPPGPRMEITAPASLGYLANTRRKR